MTKVSLYRIVWIPSALAILGMSVLFSRQSLSAPPIGKLVSVTTSDKALSVLHPDNWKPFTLSAHAVETHIRFEPVRNIKIVFDYGLKGALFADVGRSTDVSLSNLNSMLPDNAKLPLEKQKSPLQKRHEAQKQKMEKEFKDKTYAEEEIGRAHV